MSQSPELPATGWPEQPPEHAPHPAAQWTGQADASTMPQPVLPAEHASAQGAYEAEAAGLPSEFDHLFRGSPQDSRRSIDRQRPGVGAAPEAFQDPQYQAQAVPQQAHAQQQDGQYRAAQYPAGYATSAPYQAPAEAQPYAGEQYGQPEYPQAPGYGPPGYGNQGYGGGPGPEYGSPEYGGPDYGGGEFVGQGGDGSGGWGQGGGGLSGNRKRWLIGGGVAAVAVIGIVFALNSSSGSGKPTSHSTTGTTTSAHAATAQQQAQAIYSLIAQSEQLRSAANSAVSDVNACRNLTGAQSALQTTAQQRQAQADQVATLDVSLIQNGAQLVQALQQAWTASAKYDSAYASIAGDVQTGCKASGVKKDANYQTASDQGKTASEAKVQAAGLWNANVAGPLGQQQISDGKL